MSKRDLTKGHSKGQSQQIKLVKKLNLYEAGVIKELVSKMTNENRGLA